MFAYAISKWGKLRFNHDQERERQRILRQQNHAIIAGAELDAENPEPEAEEPLEQNLVAV